MSTEQIKKPKNIMNFLLVLIIVNIMAVFSLAGILTLTMILGNEQEEPYQIADNSPYIRQHSMDWRFVTYATPDFRSEIIGEFNPQVVNVIEDTRNIEGARSGWILIDTYPSPGWIYTRSNRRFIPNIIVLHENMQDEHFERTLPPQVVRIHQQQDDWVLIYTWLGLRWVNLNFTPPTAHLDELLSNFERNLAVHFENLETGFIYSHNTDRVFFSASVTKAPLALYIYQLAERGLTNLDNVHTFTNRDFMGGSGIIAHNYNVGATFTTRELLRLNLSESDNIATMILRRVYGIDGYRQFIADMGGNPNFVGNRIMDSYLTAYEAGLFAREIFSYIQSNGTYSTEFKSHLLDNQFPFIVSDYPVASKTGWTRSLAWHDMAIVFAPSPYSLTILSSREGWTPQDYRDFEVISRAFQEFNNKWFVN